MSAAGRYVPPLFIFPRVRMKDLIMHLQVQEAINPAGLPLTFWFDHFLSTVQPQARAQPVLYYWPMVTRATRNVDVIEKARTKM